MDLFIEDDGRGFEVEKVLSVESTEKGFGITGMKERTELSGGRFTICSENGSGTVIRASWPLKDIRPIL
jgi:signal transduction histidine kinase